MEDLSNLEKAISSPQPVNSGAGSQETSTASANQVARTYELREMIFENFELEDLVVATLVCKTWKTHILTIKHFHRRLIFHQLPLVQSRDLHKNDWTYRFGLQFHTLERTNTGAILLGRRQEARFALLVWYNRAFCPPEQDRVQRSFTGDVLSYHVNDRDFDVARTTTAEICGDYIKLPHEVMEGLVERVRSKAVL